MSTRPSVLLLSLTLSAVLASFAPGSAPSAQAAQPAQQAGQARPRALRPNLSRLWWNRPHYAQALGLTDEQRAAMDELMLDRIEARRAQAREYSQLRVTLGDHLAAGEWKEAEATTTALGDRVAAMARGEAELALAVTRLLQPAQREKLGAEFPGILRHPWLRGGAAARRPAARSDRWNTPGGDGASQER